MPLGNGPSSDDDAGKRERAVLEAAVATAVEADGAQAARATADVEMRNARREIR